MALSVVQAQHNQANPATAVTVNISPAAGNLLVAFVYQGVNTTSTATMSATGGTPTWTQTTSGYENSADAGHNTGMFYAMNIPSGITAVTVTWSGPISGRINIVIYEISGAATSSAEDSSANSFNSGAVTSLASGALTTTNANDILLYGIGFNGTITASSDTADTGHGYAFQTNADVGASGFRVDMAFKIVSATQSGVTTTTTWATGVSVNSVFGAFKAAAGGGVVFEDDSFLIPMQAQADPNVSVW